MKKQLWKRALASLLAVYMILPVSSVWAIDYDKIGQMAQERVNEQTVQNVNNALSGGGQPPPATVNYDTPQIPNTSYGRRGPPELTHPNTVTHEPTPFDIANQTANPNGSESGATWDDFEPPPSPPDNTPGGSPNSDVPKMPDDSGEAEEAPEITGCDDMTGPLTTKSMTRCTATSANIRQCKSEYDALVKTAENNYVSAQSSLANAGVKATGSSMSLSGGNSEGAQAAQNSMANPYAFAQDKGAKCSEQSAQAIDIRSAIERAVAAYSSKKCPGEPVNVDDMYGDPSPSDLYEMCNKIVSESSALSGQSKENADKLENIKDKEGEPSADSPTNTNGDGSETAGGGGNPDGGSGADPNGAGDPAAPTGPANTAGDGNNTAQSNEGEGGFNPLALAPLAALPFLMGGDDDEETPAPVVEEEELECKGDQVLNDKGNKCVDVLDPPECEAEGMVRNDSGVCVVADGECGGSNYPDAEGNCVPKPICEVGEYFNVDERACIEKSCPEGQTLNQNGGCESAEEVCDAACAAARLEEEENRVLRSPVQGRGERTSFESGVPSFRK